MQIQVTYNDGKVLVSFEPARFKQLLRDYFAETKDIEQAFDLIESDLKKEILKI